MNNIIMNDYRELTVRRVVNIDEAINLIENHEGLDPLVSFRLARMARESKPIAEDYNQKRMDSIRKSKIVGGNAEDKQKKLDAAENLNKTIKSILEEKVKIFVPEFNLSNFIATEDIKINGRTYEEGKLLVPIKFLTLMGDIIIDDKKAVVEPKKNSKDEKVNEKS